MPLWPADGTLATAATGGYNTQWTNLVNMLRDGDYLRVGWEMNLSDWPWTVSAANLTQWRAAWAQMYDTVKATNPTITVVWAANIMENRIDVDVKDAIVTGKVDVIGVDAYDWWPAHKDAASWANLQNTNNTTGSPATWSRGLDAWLAIAKSYNVKFALPEWGLRVNAANTNYGQDNPYFIQQMYAWMSANRQWMAYENIFSQSSSATATGDISSTGTAPNASAAYKAAITELKVAPVMVSSTGIRDATSVGRSVLTAADAAAARTAIGAGTSSLALGTTSSTAKAGNYAPSTAEVTAAGAITGVKKNGATQTVTAGVVDLGTVGTSNLTIGTTSTTAKAGDYQPTAANITDATATGRSLLTAADAAAARTAIGAGTGTVKTVNNTAPDANGNVTVAASAGTVASTSITDSTSVGRAVLTATDAAAARTAIGAEQSGVEARAISRGADLITNGTGSLGTNYNFSFATYSGSDAPVGSVGSFVDSVTTNHAVFCDEMLPIDTSKRYRFSFRLRETVAGVTSRSYGAIAPYDAQGNQIQPINYAYLSGSLTTLAQPLRKGDTTVTLTSAAGWDTVDATGSRIIQFWGWTDPAGHVWGPGTYTRATSNYDLWARGSVNAATGVITLRTAWTGTEYPAGTPVSNANSGSNYMYTPSCYNTVTPTSWTTYSDVYPGGVDTGGAVATWTTGVPPGTSQIKIGWLLNYPSGGGRQAVAGVSFSEAAAAVRTVNNTAPDAAGNVTVAAAAAGRTVTLWTNPAETPWASQPAALTEMRGQTLTRTKVDLTGYTQARVTLAVGATAGNAGSTIAVQYATDGDTQSAWVYLDGASGPAAPSSTAGKGAASGWVNLAAAAKGDVWLRVVGVGGNGTISPIYGTVTLHLK